ncbi:transglycosylase SLT domain-containing protein [Arthrobacter pigmenti]
MIRAGISSVAAFVGFVAVAGLIIISAMLTFTESGSSSKKRAALTCDVAGGAPDSPLTSVPNGWAPMVSAAAKDAGLPTSVAAAQLEQESNWNAEAVSSAGAQGLAQFMPATWEKFGNGGDPFSTEDAIAAYGRYMAALKEQVAPIAGGDPDRLVRLTLAAYNAGPGAVQEYDGIPPYAETQQYVDTILASAQGNFSMDCEAPTGQRQWDGDLGDGEWTTPLPGGVVTSGYGGRSVAGLPAWAQNHVGVDIASPGGGGGATVVAPTDLRITGFNNKDGCVIAKEDGDDPDFGFAFCHLRSYAAGKGDELDRGDVIGTEGARAGLGNIAPHLHFEIYRPSAPAVVYPYQGWNLNPATILKEKGAWPS